MSYSAAASDAGSGSASLFLHTASGQECARDGSIGRGLGRAVRLESRTRLVLDTATRCGAARSEAPSCHLSQLGSQNTIQPQPRERYVTNPQVHQHSFCAGRFSWKLTAGKEVSTKESFQGLSVGKPCVTCSDLQATC